MKRKRSLKCAAILSTLCVGMLFPMAVKAEGEYDTQEVTTYLYDKDHETEMTLAFREELPTIPYVKVTDYIACFVREVNECGAFTTMSCDGWHKKYNYNSPERRADEYRAMKLWMADAPVSE
ncbi:MAG: hypothetical protein K5897_03035 [Eubacterium sp.]|nr:hypothetical protein [Eubacterium sp.]